MMTLKAALIAASAVGTVAVGGGAAWAMTGSHQEADLRPGSGTTAVERKLEDARPGATPTCLPAKPDLPGAKLPETDAKKQVRRQLEQHPVTGDLPKTNVPETGLEGAKLPDAKLPDAELPDVKDELPADLPVCPPSGKPGEEARKAAPAVKQPNQIPAKPGVPAVPRLDCSTLKPAVKVGGPVERAVMLTKGLRHVSTVPSSAELREQNICAVTQKWADRTGRWITVQTLKTPAGMTQDQLRQALDLTGKPAPVDVRGTTGWIFRDRGAVLLPAPDGRSLLVSGSPALAGDLKNVTAGLTRAG
ncbi:MAG: hypothetical protein FWJ90_16115 [Actinomadura sp.]